MKNDLTRAEWIALSKVLKDGYFTFIKLSDEAEQARQKVISLGNQLEKNEVRI